MSLIATYERQGKEVPIGIAQYKCNPDMKTCEFGLVVTDEWQNKGIGAKLMTFLIEIAQAKGLSAIIGVVLAENSAMLDLAQYLGFSVSESEDPTIKMVTKMLMI
jgi:acetyltransferase